MNKNARDLTGEKFGLWTVIQRSGYLSLRSGNTTSTSMWLCECECGFRTKIPMSNLTTGKSKQCTKCSLSKRSLSARQGDIWESAFRRRLLNIARKKGFEVTIDSRDFKTLANQNCHYCGEPPSKVYSYKLKKNAQRDTILLNGVDRCDSSIGYTKENCVPCCTTCNIIKNKMPYKAFIEHVKQITNYLLGKGQ